MIHDGTQGVVAADSVARVATSVLDASSVPRAIRVQDTFRTAAQVRVSLVLGKASAHTVGTLRVRTAVQARVRRFERCI